MYYDRHIIKLCSTVKYFIIQVTADSQWGAIQIYSTEETNFTSPSLYVLHKEGAATGGSRKIGSNLLRLEPSLYFCNIRLTAETLGLQFKPLYYVVKLNRILPVSAESRGAIQTNKIQVSKRSFRTKGTLAFWIEKAGFKKATTLKLDSFFQQLTISCVIRVLNMNLLKNSHDNCFVCGWDVVNWWRREVGFLSLVSLCEWSWASGSIQ